MFPVDTKFMVVDDFATMRKFIKKVLGELGYTNIEEAEDGRAALPILQTACAENQPFQLIISDWSMPGMSGIELLRACKSDPHLKAVPFILITAESDQKNILEAAKAKVSDYVVKPFNAATLKEKLEKIYGKQHPSKTAV